MTQDQIPVDWFVCPVTKQELRKDGDFLVSEAGRYPYNPEGKFWNFTPTGLAELTAPIWKTWEHLQSNGVVSYNEDPEKNLGVGKRQDHLQFRDYVGFTGKILDIGVGPQRAPSHVEFSSSDQLQEFVGIDPLAGDVPKKYKFVQGLGEYIPFRDGFFDKTMFVTSLDHVVSPVKALSVARQATNSSGAVYVWLGEKSKNAPKPKQSAAWYESLSVPEGAEDRFHIKRFDLKDFEQMLKQAELRVADHTELKVDEWRSNHFYKLIK